jgi:hypothetical protein
LTRVSIALQKILRSKMDCRVTWREDALRAFAGNDE